MAVSAPLVGRVDELARLDAALRDLSAGRWSAVELVGDAGIGKTRLLDELTLRADRAGALVLSGSASELEGDLPFWVFVNALDDYVRGLDPRVLETLDDADRAELAHVFPALLGRGGDGATPQVLQRYRTHRAVRELLERLASTRPLVLVLDDFHWADPASVELLGGLLRRPPDGAVLVALALRPDERLQRLTAEIQRSQEARALSHIALGALTRSEAEQLLGSSVDEAVLSALYDESGGNPFYLEQLARSLNRDGNRPGVDRRLPRSLDVPATVAATLAEELARLSETSHLVLRGAAVVGDPFEPELAAAAAGVSELTALAALDELTRSTLVRQTDTPRRFRFRHPLLRRAVYETAPAGWRLRAHELSASALASRGATASVRAHHVERCGRKGDRAAVATLHEAGNEAVHRAPESAARWFAGALRLLRDDAPTEYRVELLLARAGALASCGHFAEGYADLLESLELIPAEAVELQVRLTTACAGMEHLLGHHDRAHRRLSAALARLQDVASPEAAALMIELAVDGVYRMQFAQIEAQATQALDAARLLGNPTLMATAASVRAWGTALEGFVPAARSYHAEASALVDDLSDQELALRLDSAVHLAGAELYLDLFESAGNHAERVIEVARTTGQPAFIPFAFMVLAWVRMLRGELADGAETLDGAIEEARLLGNDQSLAGLLLNRSLTALAAGDLELAARAARESVDLTEEMDDGLIPAAATLSLAAALLETHDPELADAVDLMVRRCGGPGLPSMPGGSFRTKWLELLTRCLLALDRPAEAERAAAEAQAIVEPLGGLHMAEAMAERASAAVALDAGDPHEAARRALASAAAADRVGIPVEAALSRLLAGRALAGAEQHARAITELERAAVALHACGAVKYRDAAELELRRLGRHVHRRSAPGVAGGEGVESLTSREREVADLVVDRCTNPEIAAALFVSPKTVETHLRHIFHKLDVSSRVEVARAIEAAPRPD